MRGPGELTGELFKVSGLIGSEDEVLEGLAALADAGATDFGAGVFAANPEDRARTMALLAAARS